MVAQVRVAEAGDDGCGWQAPAPNLVAVTVVVNRVRTTTHRVHVCGQCGWLVEYEKKLVVVGEICSRDKISIIFFGWTKFWLLKWKKKIGWKKLKLVEKLKLFKEKILLNKILFFWLVQLQLFLELEKMLRTEIVMDRITATAVNRMLVWQPQPQPRCGYENHNRNRNRGYFFQQPRIF